MKTPFNKLIASFVLSLFVISGVSAGNADARAGSIGGSGGGGGRATVTSFRSPSPAPVRVSTPTPVYTKPTTPTPTPYVKPAIPTATPSAYTKPAIPTATPSAYTKPATPAPAPVYTKPATSTAPAAMSKTDQALANKATMSGTQFTSREAAQTAFKQKYATQYTNKFDREPATRPEHIPATFKDGNRNVTVVYNQGNGGYGYYGPSGAWIMYDAMRDVAMMNMLMSRNNYAVVQPVVVQQSHGVGYFLLMTVIALVLVIGGIVVIKRLKEIPGKSEKP
ncbi:hypothetical protein M0P65_02820 [Candidatus Gracilibacteria bacterium]|nr:hypothetical protein [Candidatus Gracilibacteria bacterium]